MRRCRCSGGLASGDFTEQRTQVYLNGEVFEEGGVAISVGGRVKLRAVTSQGCTPIGETWTLTKVDQNIIHEIGNRPAYQVLAETFNQLLRGTEKWRGATCSSGLVVNEYLEDFHRGDFLIRNLLGADPSPAALPWARSRGWARRCSFKRARPPRRRKT